DPDHHVPVIRLAAHEQLVGREFVEGNGRVEPRKAERVGVERSDSRRELPSFLGGVGSLRMMNVPHGHDESSWLVSGCYVTRAKSVAVAATRHSANSVA